MTVLPLCCFPNSAWIKSYVIDNQSTIDVHENYLKQTYRNRFDIMGPNGVQTLSIPVIGQKGEKIPLNSILIEEGKWQKEHLSSLRTAYNAAPFAEHFLPEIEDLFMRPPESLVNFNLQALKLSLEWLGIEPKHKISSEYIQEASIDLRPTQKKRQGEFPTYLQVFSDRMLFEGNLSAIDLAMNCGNEGRFKI